MEPRFGKEKELDIAYTIAQRAEHDLAWNWSTKDDGRSRRKRWSWYLGLYCMVVRPSLPLRDPRHRCGRMGSYSAISLQLVIRLDCPDGWPHSWTVLELHCVPRPQQPGLRQQVLPRCASRSWLVHSGWLPHLLGLGLPGRNPRTGILEARRPYEGEGQHPRRLQGHGWNLEAPQRPDLHRHPPDR
jgi:hypothetical protein